VYDATIVAGFPHPMPDVKQKTALVGFSKNPRKPPTPCAASLWLTAPIKHIQPNTQQIMPDQNLQFPRRAISGGALKPGAVLFVAALMADEWIRTVRDSWQK